MHPEGSLHRKGRRIHASINGVISKFYVQYEGAESNFKKAEPQHTNDYGVPYDYNSVMHYSEYAFSKNQQKTIEPKVRIYFMRIILRHFWIVKGYSENGMN